MDTGSRLKKSGHICDIPSIGVNFGAEINSSGKEEERSALAFTGDPL